VIVEGGRLNRVDISVIMVVLYGEVLGGWWGFDGERVSRSQMLSYIYGMVMRFFESFSIIAWRRRFTYVGTPLTSSNYELSIIL